MRKAITSEWEKKTDRKFRAHNRRGERGPKFDIIGRGKSERETEYFGKLSELRHSHLGPREIPKRSKKTYRRTDKEPPAIGIQTPTRHSGKIVRLERKTPGMEERQLKENRRGVNPRRLG